MGQLRDVWGDSGMCGETQGRGLAQGSGEAQGHGTHPLPAFPIDQKKWLLRR